MDLKKTLVACLLLALGTGTLLHPAILTTSNKVASVSQSASSPIPTPPPVTTSPESPQTVAVTAASDIGTDEPRVGSKTATTPVPVVTPVATPALAPTPMPAANTGRINSQTTIVLAP